jgi:lysophospholipase L1-like esterase
LRKQQVLIENRWQQLKLTNKTPKNQTWTFVTSNEQLIVFVPLFKLLLLSEDKHHMKPNLMKQLLFLLLASVFIINATGQKLPPNSGIIYFGDSQTSFSYHGSGNTVQYQNFGYVSWVTALCPAVMMPKGGVLAIPGETTSQMVNRLSGLSAFGARIMVVLGGTNDPLYAIDSLTTVRNLRRIYDAGLTAGMRVMAVTILPRFAQNTYSPDVERRRLWINAWMKSQNDITVIDAEEALNNAFYFEDGLHTSPAGAYALGKLVADKINDMVTQCRTGSASAAQLTVASNSNPLMAGSTGRTSLASGTVATNWQLAGNFAGTASVVGSKEAAEDGREKQVITISGNYTGTSRRVTFNNYASAPIALSAGQVVEGIAEIEIPATATGIKAIYLKIQAYEPEYASTLADGNSMFPTSNLPFVMQAGHYVLRTPPVTIDPGNGRSIDDADRH